MVENGHSTPPGAEDEARFIASIKRMREERGWSQGELARRMAKLGWSGFHQTTVSRIEKGERPLRYGEALAFADVFGSSVQDLTAPGELAALRQKSRAVYDAHQSLLGAVGQFVEAQFMLASHYESMKGPMPWSDREGTEDWLRMTPEDVAAEHRRNEAHEARMEDDQYAEASGFASAQALAEDAGFDSIKQMEDAKGVRRVLIGKDRVEHGEHQEKE